MPAYCNLKGNIMKNVKLQLAVLSAFSALSAQVLATGFINIPTTGFATSAYTLCNTTGNFGLSGYTWPTTGANNTCAVFPPNQTAGPDTGYTVIISAVRPLIVNNIYTGSTNITVGQLTDTVWRKPAATAPVTATPMCIYGAKVVMNSTDYNTTIAGTQTFEVNDIARGGFSGLTVDAAYSNILSSSSPIYRIGRTYTSVQHRALAVSPNYGDTGGATVGTGYLDLPGFGSTASINGVNRYTGTVANALPLANPTTAQQQASVDSNWVDFTTDANAVDDDGSINAQSGYVYVKAACTTAAPVAVTNAIRVRQTAQENSPFISISVSGFTVPSGTATPAPVVPF